jgi:hypothetical protein
MTSALSHPSDTVSVSVDRLQRLEECEARADLQQRHIELLQKQVAETDAALKLEQTRGEKHAEALMHIARTCDERTSEMKEQHAATLRVTAKVEAENAALKAKLAELAASHAALKAENAALKAQAELKSTLTEILTAVTAVTTGAMEILPVRPSDSRQFVEWRVDGVPPPPSVPQFDRAWCAAVCAGGSINVDVDAAAGGVRAKVTQKSPLHWCTLLSAVPLPHGPSPRAGPGGQQQLPAYRVIVEAYGNELGWCLLGFVPSHCTHGGGAATQWTAQYDIHNYGGWCIGVHASHAGYVPRDTQYSGWVAMAPGASAYATTDKVPPMPAGSAVEFAVDYAAGTCRVAFYTPAVVAGGFVEAPQVKMELRFVATAAGKDGRLPLPARTVPTAAADSGVALFPAVATNGSGTVWRFAAV